MTIHRFEDAPHEWGFCPDAGRSTKGFNVLLPCGTILRNVDFYVPQRWEFFKKIYDERLPRNHPDRWKPIGEEPSTEYSVNVPYEGEAFGYTRFKSTWQQGSLPTLREYGGKKIPLADSRFERHIDFKIRFVKPFLRPGMLVKLKGTRDAANPYRLIETVDGNSIFGVKVGIRGGKMVRFHVASSNGIDMVQAIVRNESAAEGCEEIRHDFSKI